MGETINFFEKAKSANNNVDFLFYLNLAVIQGEYLFPELLTDNPRDDMEANNNDGSNSDKENPKENLKNNYISRYTNFAKKIKEKLKYICEGKYNLIDVDILPYSSLLAVLDREEYNVPLSVSTNGATSGKDDIQKQESEKQELIDLLTLNLFIADYDENLESEKSCEKNLKKIKKFLAGNYGEESNVASIKKILLDKAEYLLFKVRYRSKPYRKLRYNDNDTNELLTKKKENLDKEHDLFVSPENVFFEFVKKTIDHYEKEEEKNGVKEEFITEDNMNPHFKIIKKNFESSEITGKGISDFFEYNRYLKKFNIVYSEKIEKLTTIIGEVDKRISGNNKTEKNYFDDLALKSCRNLLHNTKFRLYLEEKEKNIETELFNESFYQKPEITDLTTFFEDIKDERENIPKYFDYKQYETLMLFFDRLIEDLTKQEKILNRFTFLNDHEKSEENISKYDEYKKNIFTKIGEIKK